MKAKSNTRIPTLSLNKTQSKSFTNFGSKPSHYQPRFRSQTSPASSQNSTYGSSLTTRYRLRNRHVPSTPTLSIPSCPFKTPSFTPAFVGTKSLTKSSSAQTTSRWKSFRKRNSKPFSNQKIRCFKTGWFKRSCLWYSNRFSPKSDAFQPGRNEHTVIRTIRGNRKSDGNNEELCKRNKRKKKKKKKKTILKANEPKPDPYWLRTIFDLAPEVAAKVPSYGHCGILSPLLANLFLNELDQMMEQKIVRCFKSNKLDSIWKDSIYDGCHNPAWPEFVPSSGGEKTRKWIIFVMVAIP